MNRTSLHEKHVSHGAAMVDFAGWNMPLHYPAGIIEEHCATRRSCGLFDISHMGRLLFTGAGSLSFLQHVLTGNAGALEPGKAQYTMLPDENGGAVDDAYLYCLDKDRYLLVVNAANKDKDLEHLLSLVSRYRDVRWQDITGRLAMLSVQGPQSRSIFLALFGEAALPEAGRNNLSLFTWKGAELIAARTGYTGEPLGFELFTPNENADDLWEALVGYGAFPVGLGARDTLRLEAGLPLYGHELGPDPEGKPIPIFACPLSRFAVSFNPCKGGFIGREALERQFENYRNIVTRHYEDLKFLPRIVRFFYMLDRGIARQGCKIFSGGRDLGWVTSGTSVPFLKFEGSGLTQKPGMETGMRSLGMALIDADIEENAEVEIEVRGKLLKALIVPYHLRSEAYPFSRPILYGTAAAATHAYPSPTAGSRVTAEALLSKAIGNTTWRQKECINLIPSEMTQSPFVRRLSVMDPAFRYAEHKKVKALLDADVFYYQGTDFIDEVEKILVSELKAFLECREAETRVISGQMANMTVFSAIADYINRDNRKAEPRRIRSVMNHHITKGGHLSAQPMGALKDYAALDPQTDMPAVVNFPSMADDPYRIDVSRLPELLDRHRPELIILGRSMILYKEPVKEIKQLVNALKLNTIIMYDMAHVLGLAGPLFQEPFAEGADIVTGSTHKTFFGTQRGLIAANWEETHPLYELWETMERRAFPGSVSNHHLGTLLGLCMASLEMNAFKNEYQEAVIVNAKAFAGALAAAGFSVAGDPSIGHTETHQVIVQLEYCTGVEAARRLEENNIILNFQASPREEGFTAAGALRMGVAEMTRFGMEPADFAELAGLMGDAVLRGLNVKEQVVKLRRKFAELRYCFSENEFKDLVREMRGLL